jgi:hypothetical protein
MVYATVGDHGIVDVNGTRLDTKETRVVLVYPMKSDTEDGIVTMRRKVVHTVTGQLSYEWIRVYDPNTETRYVSNFSLFP